MYNFKKGICKELAEGKMLFDCLKAAVTVEAKAKRRNPRTNVLEEVYMVSVDDEFIELVHLDVDDEPRSFEAVHDIICHTLYLRILTAYELYKSYESFKLRWLAAHNISLDEYNGMLLECCREIDSEDVVDDGERLAAALELLEERGFNGMIYPSILEYAENEWPESAPHKELSKKYKQFASWLITSQAELRQLGEFCGLSNWDYEMVFDSADAVSCDIDVEYIDENGLTSGDQFQMDFLMEDTSFQSFWTVRDVINESVPNVVTLEFIDIRKAA